MTQQPLPHTKSIHAGPGEPSRRRIRAAGLVLLLGGFAFFAGVSRPVVTDWANAWDDPDTQLLVAQAAADDGKARGFGCCRRLRAAGNGALEGEMSGFQGPRDRRHSDRRRGRAVGVRRDGDSQTVAGDRGSHRRITIASPATDPLPLVLGSIALTLAGVAVLAVGTFVVCGAKTWIAWVPFVAFVAEKVASSGAAGRTQPSLPRRDTSRRPHQTKRVDGATQVSSWCSSSRAFRRRLARCY